MTKQEIEEIVSRLKAYVNERLSGCTREEIEIASFEREYMRRLADDMPVRQGLFRLFLRQLDGMIRHAEAKVEASDRAIPAYVDGKLVDSGLAVDGGLIAYGGKRVDFIKRLGEVEESDFDQQKGDGIYEYHIRRGNNSYGGMLIVVSASDTQCLNEQVRIEADKVEVRVWNISSGWTAWEQVNEGGGMTDLGITANFNNVVDAGIYKYKTSENGISGLLFVASYPSKESSGLEYSQLRYEGYKHVYARTGTSVVAGRYVWEEWENITAGNADAEGVAYDNRATPEAAGITNVQDALDRLFSQKMSSPSASFTTREEVDGCVKEGNYGVSLTAAGEEPYPVLGRLFSLLVLNMDGDSDQYTQVGVAYDGSGYVMALRGGTSGGWTEWRQVAMKDDLPQGITDLGTVAEADLDEQTAPGVYLFATAPAVPPDTQEALVVSQSTGGASRVVTQVRFGQNIRTRSWKNSTGTWSAWTEIGGGSSVEVVQTTGQSTTAVMSQKAVTDELAKKATKTELNLLNEGIMKDEGLYEDVDTLGETFSRTSTNGEMMGYINHRIEEYAVGADAPDIFTYDEQVHTLKLTQFTVHPQEGDLSFIEQNYRGVLLDPTWSYVNFICSNEPRYFSARIGGGKCVLVDTNGETSGDHYIQLFAEAAYSVSTGNIEVSIFAEYKLSGQGAENNPLYINGNLPGYLRIWIV